MSCTCGNTLNLQHLIECPDQTERKDKLERALEDQIADILERAKQTDLEDEEELKTEASSANKLYHILREEAQLIQKEQQLIHDANGPASAPNVAGD